MSAARHSADADLPLFTWRPSKAEVIPFPSTRRADLLGDLVYRLLAAPADAAPALLDRACAIVADWQRDAGVPISLTEADLRGLRQAALGRLLEVQHGGR